ncbi:uncharacterized protein VP01_2316g5 [Puccinia sorghi]|uniref:Uncharacterized protein n=1 Tax=Puccinia sorghi TaxID=27349 RepID=A0A0L6V7M1_9BASI|nr:uncharacterized protein VP01_2316g5 [Puccinia sorghi]
MPKAWAVCVENLLSRIKATKRTFEETGEAPDEDAIKIHVTPQKSCSPTTKGPRIKPRKKRAKTCHTTRPAEILETKDEETPNAPST